MRVESDERVPVIIAVGEIGGWQRSSPGAGREPLLLMLDALAAAEDDAKTSFLSSIDSLDVICQESWRYDDAAELVAHRIRAKPKFCCSDVVYETAFLELLLRAALRVQSGECQLAAVVGAECMETVGRAQNTGAKLQWTEPHKEPTGRVLRSGETSAPVVSESHLRAFIDSATAGQWRQTPREWAMEASRTRPDCNPKIKETLPDSSTALADSGAAIVVSSLAMARSLGIPDDRLIYFWGGAMANEPSPVLSRGSLPDSPAQRAVLETCIAAGNGTDECRFDFIDLDTASSAARKVAARILRADIEMLASFGGGSIGSRAAAHLYMGHSIVAMVPKLREKAGAMACLYAEGNMMSRHCGVVLAPARCEAFAPVTANAQARANVYASAPVAFDQQYEGAASLEAYSIGGVGDSDERALVMARAPNGRRLLASVAKSDRYTFDHLRDQRVHLIGALGVVEKAGDGSSCWKFAA